MDSGTTSEGVVGLAGAVLDDSELHDVLQRLTLLASHVVGSAQSASITVVDNGSHRTSNSTGAEPLAIDEAQYRDDDGPCLRALRSGRQLEASVEKSPDRWPRFHEEAMGAHVVGVLSTPLVRGADDVVGALNIYAGESAPFGPDDRHAAELLGEIAAILVGRSLALLSSDRLNEQLRQAVATREIIGAAKGILMESQGCDRDQAFDILRRASQRENRKLRDLAEELVLRVEARATRKAQQR
jgi:GAF domain-containing protein